MKCDNSNCPESADYTFYRDGFDPVNVCRAHVYVAQATAPHGEYIVRPITLGALVADYKQKSGASNV